MKQNRNNRYQALIVLYLLLTYPIIGTAENDPKKYSLSGHLQNMNTVWIPEGSERWNNLNSTYNRLNFKWYAAKTMTLNAGARNLFTFGQLLYETHPVYSDLLTGDPGYLDLTGRIARDSSCVLYSNLDRLNVQYSKGKFEAVAGRQRINWGMNMVWNTNDIFNTFSIYDFDYVERPGCDALKMEYYTGFASSVQAAVKIDSSEAITAAGLIRFNRWNYDFQFLGGTMDKDLVLGTGWSGYLKNAGFTGEASYFRPTDNFNDTMAIFIFSSGINYTFKNSFFSQFAFLYNSGGTTENAGLHAGLLNLRNLTPKTISPARYSLFFEIAFPLTPLVRADLSSAHNPSDLSFFLGPNLDISLADNIDLLLMAQIFSGKTNTEYGDYGSFYYLRLKWSF
ncbi:MAG: hypothetical protein JXA03_00140 [Bacteroidales bacterium]|nr:hypothetical protein [Bacteroidales bacterium]